MRRVAENDGHQAAADAPVALENGEPVVISVTEAAVLAGLSRQSAYEAARRGEIPTVRIGRRILVPRKKLLRLLNGEA